MAAKRLPRLNGFWLLSVLIGMLLLVSISFYSANTDIATAEDALSTRVDYIKEQCADYSSLNLASEAKSLLRVTESAQQCAPGYLVPHRKARRPLPRCRGRLTALRREPLPDRAAASLPGWTDHQKLLQGGGPAAPVEQGADDRFPFGCGRPPEKDLRCAPRLRG